MLARVRITSNSDVLLADEACSIRAILSHFTYPSRNIFEGGFGRYFLTSGVHIDVLLVFTKNNIVG